MAFLGEVLVKLTGDPSGLKRAVDEGKRSLGELPAAAKQAGSGTSAGLVGVGSAASVAAQSVGALTIKIAATGAALIGLKYLVQGTAAALTAAFMGPIRAMASLSEEAYAFGASASQLSRLQLAAGQVGLTIDQLRMSVAMFASKLDEANADKLSRSFAVFKTLGVDIAQGAIPALEQFAQKLAALPNQEQAIALGREFGGRTGARLIVLGADLDNVKRAVERTGAAITDEMGAAADEAEDAVTRMHAAIEGLKNRAVAPLVPIVEQAANRLTDFFATDPRGLELATAATRRIGEALDYMTRPESIAGIAEVVTSLGNLAGSLFRAAGAAAQLTPQLTTTLNLLTGILNLVSKLPPEVGGALFGAAVLGRFGPAGAATGAVMGAVGGTLSRATTTESDLVEQRASAAEAVRKQEQFIEARGGTTPAIATELVRLRERVGVLDAQLAAIRGPAVTSTTQVPPGGLPAKIPGPQVVFPDLKGEAKAASAGGGIDREAERLAEWWAKAPAQIEDIRDAEERLAVTRDAAVKDYADTVRKPTLTEAIGGGADYFATMADALEDADREAERAAEHLKQVAESLAEASVRSSAFAAGLELLFGQGPIEDRLGDVLQRRFADILDALYKSVAAQSTEPGAVPGAPWTTAIRNTLGLGEGVTGSLGQIERIGGLALSGLSVGNAALNTASQIAQGVENVKTATEAAQDRPGVTESDVFRAGTSQLPFVGSMFGAANRISSAVLGRNAPGAAYGALSGGLMGGAAGAGVGVALGTLGGGLAAGGLGGAGGAAGGVALGASMGSAVPVLGTAIGAAVGAVIGALLSKAFQPPTAESQLNRALFRFLDNVGVPRVLEGDRGINLRAYGRRGGPSVPAYEDLDMSEARRAGTMFAWSVKGLPEGAQATGRISQFLVNTATALKLTATEADRMFKRFEAPLFGKSLDEALYKLAALRALGSLSAEGMTSGFGRALQIFEDLPKSIDASRLALAALGDEGRLDFDTLKNAAADAKKVIADGLGDAFEVLVQTASADAAGRSMATTFAGTFLEAVQQELAQAPLSSLLTDAVVTARQAAVAFREGDRVLARQLLREARDEFARGRAELLQFLQPVGMDTRAWTQGLTGMPGGFVNQMGVGLPSSIPSLDVGGLVPGALGQPMLAVIHGGENVMRPQDTQQMIGLLQQVASAVSRGWSVVMQDRTEHVLTIDGRELSRVQANTDRMHRGAGIVLPRAALGVR